ncbi:MAG: hypothetical protein Q4B85_06635 [Lachnospiraceae bacterium]|nr:hypothetical protein [Lachnospiraceae bacterium]
MADNNGGAAGAAGSGANSGVKTFTQDEVNRMISSRVNEEKAKYADYDTLKDKAGKYDQYVENGKSELQKANERADSLQRQIDQLTKEKGAQSARDKVSAELNVPVNLLTGDTEEECRKQAEAILAFAKPQGGYPGPKKVNNNNANRGSSAADASDEKEAYRVAARQIFGGGE